MYNQMTRRNLTKAEREMYLTSFLQSTCGINVTQTKKIQDSRDQLRHSCFTTGITFLNRNILEIPMQFGSIPLYYYVCDKCGKAYIVNSEV